MITSLFIYLLGVRASALFSHLFSSLSIPIFVWNSKNFRLNKMYITKSQKCVFHRNSIYNWMAFKLSDLYVVIAEFCFFLSSHNPNRFQNRIEKMNKLFVYDDDESTNQFNGFDLIWCVLYGLVAVTEGCSIFSVWNINYKLSEKGNKENSKKGK